jgi:predicted dehydrogenase
MRKIGAAVVGTGFIGPVHVEAIRRLGHRVVGILGSSPDKSRSAAASLGLEKGYGTLNELLNDRDVDVVHLASPNREHFGQCQLVLDAGKHVICEKPLAMTSSETRKLADLARSSSLITAVNYNIRFYPLILETRERFRRGDFGRLFHVTGSYLQDWLLFETDYNWRVDAGSGGELRAVADIGTHWLDTVCFITGMTISSVCADLATVHPIRQRPTGPSETFTSSANTQRSTTLVPVTTEDHGSILFRFSNGAKGSLTVSQVCAGRKNCLRFDLAGSQASLSWDSEVPNQMTLGYRHRANERVIRDPSQLSDAARRYSDYPGGHAEGFPDTFKMLYRAVYADIAAGTKNPAPLYATFDDGHREVLLCEAILKSHREQRWIEVAV